jgi:hypothetical protein
LRAEIGPDETLDERLWWFQSRGRQRSMARFPPQPGGTEQIFSISLSLVARRRPVFVAPHSWNSEKLAPVAVVPIVLTGPNLADPSGLQPGGQCKCGVQQQHPAPTPTSAAQIAAPPAVAGTLTINTNTATGSGPSSLLGNHAWLTFVTADGTVYTYGTYGNGNGAQGVEGVNENSELSYPATGSRSAAISADQARNLGGFINDMIKQGPAA